MKIKLTEDPDPIRFGFKIGDKVRSKMARIEGTVIAGEYFPGFGDWIFYAIKLPDGTVFTYMQGDIELVQEQRPSEAQAKPSQN